MSDFKFDKSNILEKTNGGLQVILRLFPNAEKNGRFVHFKLREEDTASAMIKKMPDNNYIVTDFGGDGKGKNCFDLVMEKEGLSFADACKWISSEFSIDGSTVQFNKPEIEFKAALKNQNEKDHFFEYHSEISDEHLSVLGPLVTNKVCDKYNLKSCSKLTKVYYVTNKVTKKKELTQIIIRSTEKYPIFVIDEGSWQKIYEPLNIDKSRRFSYAGEKPKDYLFGKDNLELEFQGFLMSYDGDDDEPKFPHVFIGAGDRDSLNISSLGYPVVWQNSETAILSYADYKFLRERAHKVLYIGDIDETGISETIKIALRYIDIHIIWLPDYIKNKVHRNKPGKDFTDWINLTHKKDSPKKIEYAFRGLITDALPSRFWDEVRSATGELKKYTFNNEACYRFLTYNGYFRFEENTAKEDFSFIHLKDGIVKRVKYHHLNNFPANYIKEKKKPIPLVNFIHRSAQLSEKSLAKLPQKEINFKDSGYDHQLMFFKNKTWKITKDEIKEYNYGQLDAYVWEDKIIQHDVKVHKSKAFEVIQLGFKSDGKTPIYDINILKTDNHFLNYMINTSRVHWRVCGDKPFKFRIKSISETDPVKRKELIREIKAEQKAYQQANRFNIEEEGLSQDEIKEQKDHLINKLFAFGYLLHKQKVDDKGWMVFAMDNRISEIADSNGGSGKSLMFEKAIRKLLINNKYIAGRDREALKNQFMYEGITPDTDYVLVDDADSHFPITKFFSEVTGDFNVNAKHKGMFTIPFEESPKFAITSNFGLFKPDSSTERRILYCVFSDYYHYKSDLDENEHKVTDDIGKLLFSQFDSDEWNDFFNLSAEAVQFHLGTKDRINPPLGNVEKRNSLQTMGDGFKDWADFYFEHKLDNQLVKNIAYNDFETRTKLKGWSSQRFKKSVKEWCKFHGYEVNPEEVLNSQGMNKHNHNGSSTEFIYIKSSPTAKINERNTGDEDNTDANGLVEGIDY
ncbi:primase-helicase family protein [uncultured Aquimarina sp.]|uniref:primase-helicase family protein n=1 Tax=uncultured Aquimarina sp. TaxID=575652 RepID=UPI00261C1363|nr:primase-helicase family protein [uncultured Aquimarina sp.]